MRFRTKHFASFLTVGFDGEGDASASGGGTPPVPPTPDPEKQALLDRLARAERDANDARQLASTIVQNYSSNQNTRPIEPTHHAPVPSVDDVEPDFDSMTPKEMAAYFKRQNQIALSKFSSDMGRMMQERMQLDDARWHNNERARVENELRSAGMGDVMREVDAYVAQNNISREALAQPGVYRRAVALVMGERLLDEKLSASTRAPALSSAGGGGAPSSPSASSADVDEELAFLAKRGIKMSKDDWAKHNRDDNPMIDVAMDRLRGGVR